MVPKSFMQHWKHTQIKSADCKLCFETCGHKQIKFLECSLLLEILRQWVKFRNPVLTDPLTCCQSWKTLTGLPSILTSVPFSSAPFISGWHGVGLCSFSATPFSVLLFPVAFRPACLAFAASFFFCCCFFFASDGIFSGCK